MLAQMSDGQRTAALRLLAVGGAAAALLWLFAPRRRRPRGGLTPTEEREKLLLPILAEMSRRFFTVCMDVASVTRTVRAKIEAGNVQIADDRLREQIARQCQVFEKLRDIELEVAQQFNVSSDEVEEMQGDYAKDQEVIAYSEGLTVMLNDALGGEMPVLPNVKIPDSLTEGKVLQILGEVNALEMKKVLERVGGKVVSVRDLGEALAVAHREAWDQMLDKHAAAIGGGKEVYHSAMGTYMRGADFAKRREKLEEAHRQRMTKFFQPDHQGQKPEQVVAGH